MGLNDEYRQVLQNLYALQKFGIKFGLNKTENLLERLGNPHRLLRCIHIGGTNGKGSVAAMISSVLSEHGYRVGRYTSPHLVRFTERFCIDGSEVSPELVIESYRRVSSCFLPDADPPTFFEVTTAMAFDIFKRAEVDFAVIEVGMGGRLDATNVIKPEVSIITNVAMDHQEFLGCTLASIAREKAGIIKERVPVVTGAKQPLVQGIIKATCYRKRAPIRLLGEHFRFRKEGNLLHYFGYSKQIKNLYLSLAGDHQKVNASVALAALEVLEERGLIRLKEDLIRSALRKVRWPARLEVLDENPLTILDGAHNPQGAETLKQALRTSFSFKNLHLVLGIMADKDIKGIFRRLLPEAETVIFTRPRYVRAADPETLRRIARPYTSRFYVIPDVREAISYARREAEPDDLICITGSLYFAGEVKEIYGEKPDP
ncbi:bifunctional folylpolyglutamate synthase/dihydrofolate synthase [Thermodesulforhabdus norvegica]|uniref:Dihydrofolate synthase/folylpolyglutamate synthase n=1 Tax=Thermodesulforhabdus norvegica TaxID=39841 RepID=A0A1I4V4W7_9BACT|nr:folylpolyglutamate synthase/dihydrofolate synthase family protein [Thermodesulforhabdus norvegica]SFM96215.1 dihydrofolate synthase / folylpolyglutamate synthase [Thermodesulforhabdus norvegica]